jgi:hypothetical protein
MTLMMILMSGYPIGEILKRLSEWAWMGISRRLPRKLAYYSFIDSGTRYMPKDEVVPEVRYMDVLNRMPK